MNLKEAYYEAKFEAAFLRAKGQAFQEFFERLMSFAYKADFMPCRPWGAEGDHKNDGFLKSEKRLFQVYAPYEMDASTAKAKISEDFDGAKVHWGGHFDKWTFVHNGVAGLPPHVQKLILDFEFHNPGITLDPWCLEELRTVFRGLSEADKSSWFGPVPDEDTRARLGFKDLEVVLTTIAGQHPLVSNEVKSVPQGKIEANALSEAVARLLKEGMTKAPLLEDFFSKWHDEGLDGRLAEAFKTKYLQLRDQHLPVEVFVELQAWAGGEDRGSPEHELAVLTVLAYYFERCDIFEAPLS